MINTISIAELAQQFMAAVESEHPDGHVMNVAIVAEVREEGDIVNTPTACTNDSRIYQTGLFQWAIDSVQWSGEPMDEDEMPPPGDDS